jgi:hypothetical protein
VSPDGSEGQRGSLISSQARIVGSSLYASFVIEFILVIIAYESTEGENFTATFRREMRARNKTSHSNCLSLTFQFVMLRI